MGRTMIRSRWAVLVVAAGASVVPTLRGQDPGPAPAPAQAPKAAPGPAMPDWARLVEDDIKPLPPEAIPDDPPPHEGNWFAIAHRLAPTDLVFVEVLEAYPGRPITGERLVRPDGTISLHWYGDIYIAGLTCEQVKAKVILHLRSHLTDLALGLVRYEEGPGRAGPGPIPPDPFPPSTLSGLDLDAVDMPALPGPGNGAGVLVPLHSTPGEPMREAEKAGGPKAEASAKVEEPPHTPFPKSVRGGPIRARPAPRDQIIVGPPEPDSGGKYGYVPLARNNKVCVDVAAYNSTVFHVLGDVGAPGIRHYTGRDTVLETLQDVGGLLPMADRHNIRLNRPGRGDKPARSYRIDLDAIERGEKKANLQLFPGDRLIVGRKGDLDGALE